MLKKKLSICFISILFLIITVLYIPHDKVFRVTKVLSPIEFELDSREFKLQQYETFDSNFTQKNKELAQNLNISETEAFILGNLAKYWTINLMQGRRVYIKDNKDLVYLKYSYLNKFLYSGFCIKNKKPYYQSAFDKKVFEIRKIKYKVLNLDNNIIYDIEDEKVRELKNFIIIKKSHIPKEQKQYNVPLVLNKNKIKILFSDSTVKYRPDRSCSTAICHEILDCINSSKSNIDVAIYGYSKVPEIEKALISAIKRGVKIRLIYDLDSQGKNIYPDTSDLVSLIKSSNNDGYSLDARNIMHNKFFIFDDEKLITGSANLSHTDMSGFNTNSIIKIDSPEIAKIYKQEFEQMYFGKFHTEKISNPKSKTKIADTDFEIYFSPQDKSITNAVLPLIRNAKEYIYIPTFVLTEKRVTEELIKAKSRGVDVKIIMDALNASIRHTKHNELRQGGISVKTENYAGKMHSKSILIDDKYTIIGSMNFSNSGENKNDENLLVIKDSEITKFYKTFFLYQWNKIDNRWLKYNVRAESKDSIGSCFDGIDNNYDGYIDSKDQACK